MANTLKKEKLATRSATRAFLALTLATSLAAFGCTTNRTPGNGDPIQGAPGAGPGSPTSGVNGGSSSGTTTTTNPPMMSSSTYGDPLPTVTARSTRLPLSADEAAAIMAGNDYRRGVRVLGPVNPGSAGRAYHSDGVVTGQFINPAHRLGGIVTVNSSVNSVAHVPALASDSAVGLTDGGAVIEGGIAANGLTANATVGAPSGLTTGVTTVAPATTTVANTSGVGAAVVNSPTANTLPLATGAFAAGPTAGATAGTGTFAAAAGTTLSPTTAAATVVTPTLASSGVTVSNGVITNGTAATTTNGTSTTNGTTTASATAARTTTRTAASAGVSNPVRVTQDANGRVTVTNVKSQK